MKKLKLIIVDDDTTVHSTIKQYLNNNKQFEVVAAFSNAKIALRWLAQNEVDIILSDMQMPNLSGLEFMQLLRTSCNTVVIAISSYDDYDYLRGCMINGAADYVLKCNLNEKTLLEVLGKAKDKYSLNPENTVARKIGYCINDKSCFTKENIISLISNNEIDFSQNSILPLVFSPNYKIHADLSNSEHFEYKEQVTQTIIDLCSRFLINDYNFMFYKSEDKKIILLIDTSKNNSYLLIQNSVSNLCSKIKKSIMRMLDISITVGIGTTYLDLQKSIEQSFDLLKNAEDSFYLGENYLFNFNTGKSLIYSTNGFSKNTKRSLEYAAKNNNWEQFENLVCDALESCEQERIAKKDVVDFAGFIFETLNLYKLCEKEEIETYSNLILRATLFSDLQNNLAMWLHEKIEVSVGTNTQAYSETITNAVDYIEKNYTNDISLEGCAEHVGVSYAYLSREFKKETGKRFIEYLNIYKIEKAKSLLVLQRHSMKEITIMCGFYNYNYFFRVFKEIEGITPTEFTSNYYSNL